VTLRSLVSAVVAIILLCPIAAAGETPPFPFTLSKPAGDGPFPAVVILHDCSGLGPRSSGMAWRWSSELTRRGYVTIWPDSFTSRGRPKGVCTEISPPRVTFERRAGDAYAALAYLASLPFVDARRIAVMGGSHGGSSTLAAIVDAPENAKRTDAGFAAAIALYPACGRSYGAWSVQRSQRARKADHGLCGRLQTHCAAIDPHRRPR
jgi:dienelactone hydrolase